MATIASINRISASRLADMIRTYEGQLGDAPFAIVDVRDTDYIGGHIKGCTNIPSHSFDIMLPGLIQTLANKPTIVFHCALSQQRGPAAALKFLRELQRLGKASNHQVMVLEGGFTSWQELYGADDALTEDYDSGLWRNGW
ncbi:Cdc25 phosphatase Ibp1 [Ceratocystis pirilliformis]|uniref:Cdc25 phosphatase Ibp1 n=1 Tax=Ceratocystis pirilliformis TaxID=259994 RepID=A0ABR3YFG1_9PEZI